MEQQARINVDKLYISYLPNEKLTKELVKLNKGEVFYCDGFELLVRNKTDSEIYARLTCGGYYLGDFIFNKNSVVFQYNNEILYSKFGKELNGKKYNFQPVGEAVIDSLGLQPINVTTLELAIDSNKPQQLRALIGDHKHYDMIYNGRKLKENEGIPNYHEDFGRCRKALQRFPTVYFGQSRKDGIKFKLYDKTREIKQASGKDYIIEFNDLKGSCMYRFEATIGSTKWKDWLEYSKDHLRDDYKLLPNETIDEYNARSINSLSNDEAYKLFLWNWLANRVLYFIDKDTNEKITLLDLCSGWQKPHRSNHNGKKK